MTKPGTVVMVFNGEYDLTSKHQLREAFSFLADAERAVLDFNEVTYLDSTALSELTLLHKSRKAAGLDAATIVTSNGNILRLFEIVDMRQFFHFTGAMPEIAADGDPVNVHDASTFGTNGSQRLPPLLRIDRIVRRRLVQERSIGYFVGIAENGRGFCLKSKASSRLARTPVGITLRGGTDAAGKAVDLFDELQDAAVFVLHVRNVVVFAYGEMIRHGTRMPRPR